MAVGALSYLNAERLAPLRGRRIELFPDLSVDGHAFDRWNRVAGELLAQGFQITVSTYLVNYPFANRLFPNSLDVLEHCRQFVHIFGVAILRNLLLDLVFVRLGQKTPFVFVCGADQSPQTACNSGQAP